MTTMTREAITTTTAGRLPDFLIIGAAKSGTTTLYEDLRLHPNIFLPDVKEPNSLCDDQIFSSRGLRQYSELFETATPVQICGEASTYYTMKPIFEGVPERARRLLGPNIKLIYIVRDPVRRTLSQYGFHYKHGDISSQIDSEIRDCSKLIDWSRYAMQIEPWIETFGRASIHVALFEDYIHNRQVELNKIFNFLEVPSLQLSINNSSAYNQTESIRPLRGGWREFRSTVAQLTPFIPRNTRSKFRWIWKELAKLQRPLPTPPTASDETKRFVADAVRDDSLRFAELTGVDISAWGSLNG